LLRATNPILCYVTERQSLAPSSPRSSPSSQDLLVARIREAARAGLDWIQLREKNLTGRAQAELATRAVEAAGSFARIIVNDRLDVAVAAQTGGVHLGGESLPVEQAVRWRSSAGIPVRGPQSPMPAGEVTVPPASLPASFLVGVSCHQIEEAAHAERAGADYVFFGPVFATPSKAAFGPPQGLARLAKVCSRVRIPVIAIGGITAANVRACIEAGAAGIAAIRLFQEAADLPALVAGLRQDLTGARGLD
jgi:thiamine-phosphate pyrophosphorylase